MPAPITRSLRFLDLFCGIGGLGFGLQRAGMELVGGIDIWAEALATYRHNHPGQKCLEADLSRVDARRVELHFGMPVGEIDLIAGGPPCQGFSTVGKRNNDDPRNLLWMSFHRLVDEVRPAYVLIENVEGLNVMEKGGVRDRIIGDFEGIGYRMKASLLRAADFGVPQLRKRMFFLGWRDGVAEPDFPTPLGSSHVTVADAIFDLPALAAGQATTSYGAEPRTPYQIARRGKCRVLHNHEAAKHPNTLVEILKYIPDGGNRKSIPDDLQPTSGFHNSYARLASWKPAIAVTSNMRKPSSARATHPTQHRGLTVREGLRLQSFDDDFVVVGSRTSQYLQVGNAVPPLLAEAVGAGLVKAFRATTTSDLARSKDRRACVRVRRSFQPTFWDAAT